MNNLLWCLSVAPILAGLAGCAPTPEPMNSSSTTTGASAMAATDNTNAPPAPSANRPAATATPAPAPSTTPPPPPSTEAEERKAVAKLQWLNSANPQQRASSELAQAKAQGRKPAIMAFAGRGLSYPGLSPAQLAKIRRKVNDNITDGSGDTIFGPTHRNMRKKLRDYAIAYNRAIAAGIQ